MIRFTSLGMLVALFVTFSSPANAERAWSGSIHLVDANLVFDFDGYDYGNWDNVGRLTFPGRSVNDASAKFVGFRIAADAENPLQATLRGKIRVKVDGKSAELKDLILVRASKYANWKIDPKIIQRLKKQQTKKSQLPTNCDSTSNSLP